MGRSFPAGERAPPRPVPSGAIRAIALRLKQSFTIREQARGTDRFAGSYPVKAAETRQGCRRGSFETQVSLENAGNKAGD
ncbi:hypothetical protein [Propylenella binzhouense]|uniref:hypothetical protein n=1 Tax=Propylenella binzhouense TaxID=2555902 RepID=UPI00136D0FE7|nr:hypothetical protein [Propylenella binzhouense]